MSAPSARGNRVVLAVAGIVLLGAAAYAFIRGFGQLAGLPANGPVVPAPALDLARSAPWFWPVVAVGASVIALIGLRWFLVQSRTNRIDSLTLVEDDRGAASLDARAFATAVADAAASGAEVHRARAALVETRRGKRLRLTVVIEEIAAIPQLRSHVTDVAQDARHTLDDASLPTVVRLRVRRRRRTVRVR